MNSKTIALLFAMFSLGGMVAIPGLTVVPQAQAQLGDDLGIILLDEEEEEEEEEESEDESNTQTIEQPIDQELNQDVNQEQNNEQDNDNTQTQVGRIDQDIAQGIVDGDDEAESESESGDAHAKKHSSASSSSSSGDASNENLQGATNDARLQQLQVQNVDQDNEANFAPQDADLDAANVAIPIAVPINVQDEEEEEDGEDGEDGLVLVCERQGGENSPIGNVILIPEGEEPPEGFSEENCVSRDPGNGGNGGD